MAINHLCRNKNISLIVLGGRYTHGNGSTYGEEAEKSIEGMKVDVMFTGADGLDETGVTSMHEGFSLSATLSKYYIKKHHKEYLTFRAELAWEVISSSDNAKNVNALALEEWLADISDIVIILVESFGTVAELGAFSLSPSLRKKLLPILDKQFERHTSFINTGPVMWVNNDSKFNPTIYTDFKTILTCIPQINDRLNRKIKSSVSRNNLHGLYLYSPKVLLFFLLYVIASLGPISAKEISNLSYDIIKLKDRNKNNTNFMLSLGIALGLFKKTQIGHDFYYSCVDFDKFFNHESTKKMLAKILKSRARALSDLIMIPAFKKELGKVMKNAN